MRARTGDWSLWAARAGWEVELWVRQGWVIAAADPFGYLVGHPVAVARKCLAVEGWDGWLAPREYVWEAVLEPIENT